MDARAEATLVAFDDIEDIVPDGCLTTLVAVMYLKCNNVYIQRQKPTNLNDEDLAPFFRGAGCIYKELRWDFPGRDATTPLINLTGYWNFEVDARTQKPDPENLIGERKNIILIQLLPFQRCVFSMYKNIQMSAEEKQAMLIDAIAHIQNLSDLLGADNYFLNWGLYISDVDAVFITAGVLIFKKFKDQHLELSALYKELRRHTNLYWLVQKYFDMHFKPHGEIVDLSHFFIDTGGEQFHEFLESYTVIQSSTTAEVYLCDFSPNNALQLPTGKFIIKKFRLTSYGIAGFAAESHFLKLFRHDNVVEIIAVAETREIKLVVLRYYVDGDLSKLVKGTAGPSFSWKRTLDILIQISYILHMMHTYFPALPPLVYSDFKPENFLLDGDNIRLCDLASIGDEGISSWTESDPYKERVNGESLKSAAADICKFGKFMVLLLTTEPIEVLREDGAMTMVNDLGQKIVGKRGVLQWNELIRHALFLDNCQKDDFDEALDLAILCLDQDRRNRPTACKIVDTLRNIQEQI